uniref:Putative reverse transcriptase domain-containing protein n=1 Tax=Tanacetum cinerariifolium TaxID=118510 RepID=A0A699H5W4_TANCI|nr:putative reverse transcriptase domain-containing protein [Tanacetum cinerariifolium]
MDLHAVSHLDGLVRFSKGSDDMSEYIVGISKPSNKEPGTKITEGLVFNAELLDRVFKVLITTVKWKDDDITTLVKSILDGSTLGSFGQCGGVFLKEGATGNTNIKQCLRKVSDGHFTAAVKVLSSSGVASYCDDTIKSLEAKHPYKPPPSMHSITFSEPPLVAEIDSVFSCIKSFPKGTSCGRDGLRAQHILDELCGEGSATATDLLKVITSIVNLWLAGRRLVSKVAMKGVGKEMSNYLSDFQFGVEVSGSAEAILHSVNRVLSEYHNDGSLALLNVDFSNAFNLVDRPALLHERPSSGVKLLGGVVSRDADFISGLAMRRAANAVELMGLLPQLHDPQTSRTQSWVLQDHILRDSGICGMYDDYVSALACLRDTFPSFDVSGFTNEDTAPSKGQQTMANVFFLVKWSRI